MLSETMPIVASKPHTLQALRGKRMPAWLCEPVRDSRCARTRDIVFRTNTIKHAHSPRRTVMLRPSVELMQARFADVAVAEGLSGKDSLMDIARARDVLVYRPESTAPELF